MGDGERERDDWGRGLLRKINGEGKGREWSLKEGKRPVGEEERDYRRRGKIGGEKEGREGEGRRGRHCGTR